MSIKPQTPGVHHVALRVSDVARAKRFYTETLGFPMLLDGPDLFLFAAGGTAFGVRLTRGLVKFRYFPIPGRSVTLGSRSPGIWRPIGSSGLLN
ncbi:MAG: VOC family protein [Gemmatimonadales bacterium]